MKYLKLQFRNAGFFIVDRNTKDFVFDLNGRRRRTPSGQKVSISVNQISNMLHVLLGERPSATYRETLIEPIPEIREIANSAMIHISTMRYFNEKTGKCYYGKQFINTNKSIWNSWRNTPELIYWKRIENLLTDNSDNSLYVELIDILERILNKKVTNDKALNIVNEINSKYPNIEEFETFKLKLISAGKKPLADFLTTGRYNTEFSMNPRTRLMTISGIENVFRISGSIIIPLDEIYINKLKASKGCARLLDGGVVFIDALIDEEYLGDSDLDGYININKLQEYENIN